MFGQARLRLTLSFSAALLVILAVIGLAVYFTTRTALFDQVNGNLEERADRVIGLFRANPLRPGAQVPPGIDQALTAGGYFWAIVDEDGAVPPGFATATVEPDDLVDAETREDAFAGGPLFVDTRSTEGENLRVYVRPVRTLSGRPFLLQVGRSTEPERQALARLVLILAAGGGAGFLLAVGGGFVLAGRALRPIQDAMQRQRGFVADASHELRTPLALIRANAEVLKRESEKAVQSNITSVDDIIQETDRLSNLVGQMLRVARADTGERPTLDAEVDLQALAADVARQMRLLAQPKGIELRVSNGAPAPVHGDETLLRELLAILLDNAIKYGDGGSSVEVSVQRRDGSLRLQVADTGRGIPKEALPHIFERFYRADKARSREMGGSGLGLAIARWIAESHKGTIGIESEAGRGTTVTVELPASGSRP